MIIGKTQSVCPVCLNRIPANKVVGEDGNIYLEKRCFEHGSFRTLIWEGDLESYQAWAAEDANGKSPPSEGWRWKRAVPMTAASARATSGTAAVFCWS